MAEAVAAIDWTNASGPEWHLGLVAAVGANSWVHLPRATASTAITTALLAGLSVFRTPTRLVGKPTAGVELLLSCRKNKRITTICTNQLFILGQWTTSVVLAGSGRSSNGKEDK